MNAPRPAACLKFLCCFVALTALAACEDESPSELSSVKSWEVPVYSATQRELEELYTVIGSVVADRNINISSRISSYIRQLNVQEGEAVKEGQLLIVLDDEELDNNINQAKAAVEATQAIVNDVSTDLTRFKQLLEQGSISAIKVRKTQLQKSTAIENLNSAKAALSVAESQRQYTQIRSPATGIVTKRYLQAGDLTTPGAPLLSIESRSNLKFETYVAESQLGKIALNDSVAVQIDNVPEAMTGRVAQIIYAGHPVSRSFKVSIALPAGGDIYTGMFGRASFTIGKKKSITIPASALIEKGGLSGVYVIDDADKVWFRWLRVRRSWPDEVEIAAGLNVGERLVGTAPHDMHEGDLVIATASKPSQNNSDGSFQ